MRVLVAPDCFGGTLSAEAAAAAIAAGWLAASPGDHLDLAPMSDGGPGFLDILAAALPGSQRLPLHVRGPRGTSVAASVLLAGRTAYVESAQACGLHLLTPAERDPTATMTYGVGDLIAAAVASGATCIVVGLGGSATNDGGAGCLAALGFSGALSALADVELVVAADVAAPLLGAGGASRTFAKQKGATVDQVAELESAMTRWAAELADRFGDDVRDRPGAGAAGGLGAALLALGGVYTPGARLTGDLLGLPERAAGADLVVTGEGTFDATSLRGKVVSEVAHVALEAASPCLVLAGAVAVGRQEAAAAGVTSSYSLVDEVGTEAALGRTAAALDTLAQRVAKQWAAPSH